MLEWLMEAVWLFLRTLGGWFLALLGWVWEMLAEIITDFLVWALEKLTDLVVAALGPVGAALDKLGLIPTIKGSFEWLRYIDDWVPVTYGITLIVAYYLIKLGLLVVKWVLIIVRGH